MISLKFPEQLTMEMKFTVFAAVNMKFIAFWHVTPCMVGKYQSFGEMQCQHIPEFATDTYSGC
jgi:hypothetical protein